MSIDHLQSQTQSGTRYTPYLTRFYTTIGPSLVISLIQEALEKERVKCKPQPPATNERGAEVLKLRIGGFDARRQMFKGWVAIERFVRGSVEGSYCMMRRDEVRFFGSLSMSLLTVI